MSDHNAGSTRYTWLIVLITLLACAARFVNLGGDSLWFDEILTLDRAREDLAQVLAAQELDRPPGYYAIEHVALNIWGTNEYALRLASALAGVATIPLTYVLGNRLADRRVGLWGAALLAVSPFHIRYSQEARGYAIQVAAMAASHICLLLALERQRIRWWVGFGVLSALNAYILFGSFVVLASQIAFVGLLSLVRVALRQWTPRRALTVLAGLALGAAITAALYSPWIGPAVRGMSANIGPEAKQGRLWADVPIGDWLSTSYFAFGFMNPVLAAGLGGLGLAGIGSALIRRQVDQLLWLLLGLCVPFLLISFVGVSRAPLPKYVLFVLPVYVLAAAIGLEQLLGLITSRLPRFRAAPQFVRGLVAIGLLAVGVQAILAEHAYVYTDWKAVAQYLGRAGQAGDVAVPITLDLPDGFNEGSVVLAYYLPQRLPGAHLLLGEHLADPSNDLAAASKSTGAVWLVLFNRVAPVRFDDPAIESIQFQGPIYLVRSTRGGEPLVTLLDLYQKIIPQALTPSPRCYLWLDVAVLQIQLGRYDDAWASVASLQGPCPDTRGARQEIYGRLLNAYQDAGRTAQAREAARQLLTLDVKDRQALDVLSVHDLGAMAEAGEVDMVESPALPIQRMRFSMPQDGDWGDALVMQTPAQIVYRLALPVEPVAFRARIAMAPDSWEWGGDGATFIVRLQDESGREMLLFEQHVSNAEADRHWHAVTLPLDAYAGQTITLTLVTAPGSSGDTTGDWAGWDSPRVVYAPTE